MSQFYLGEVCQGKRQIYRQTDRNKGDNRECAIRGMDETCWRRVP